MTKLLDLLEVYLRWRQLPEVGGCAGARVALSCVLRPLPPVRCRPHCAT